MFDRDDKIRRKKIYHYEWDSMKKYIRPNCDTYILYGKRSQDLRILNASNNELFNL